MKKLIFSTIAVALVALIVLAGCTQAEPTGQAINATAKTTGETANNLAGTPSLPSNTFTKEFNVYLNSVPGTPREINQQLGKAALKPLVNKNVSCTVAGNTVSFTASEKIGISSDLSFDYLHSDVEDLVAYIDSDNDLNYFVNLGTGMPYPYNAQIDGGNCVIPFFGKDYRIWSIDDSGAYLTVQLKPVSGGQTIQLVNAKGYPYDPDNATGVYDWKVTMMYDTGNSNKLESITIGNSNKKWDDDDPIFAAEGALTEAGQTGKHSAIFLKEAPIGTPGKGFFKYTFDGYEANLEDPVANAAVLIGDNRILYTDMDSQVHSIPFYIKVSDNTSSSFTFDAQTIYYQASRDKNGCADVNGTDWNKLKGDGCLVICSVPISQCDTNSEVLYASTYVDGAIFSSAALSLLGNNNRHYSYGFMVSENYGEIWFLLGYNVFTTNFNKTIYFDGTDKTENGSTNESADASYYLPDAIEFSNYGGDSADTSYFIAVFRVAGEDGTGYPRAVAFIDTATDELISLPNNNLSFYSSDAEYYDSIGQKTWFLRSDTPELFMSKVYSDYLAQYSVSTSSPYIFTATLPQTKGQVKATISMTVNTAGQIADAE